MKHPIRFVIISVVVFAFLFLVGGGLIGVPLFSAILGSNVEATYMYILYWGLILLAGFVAVCTAIIVQNIRDGNDGQDREEGKE